MQSVESILSRKPRSRPEILCGQLPPFDSTNLENVRRAFQSAISCPFQQGWLDEVEINFSPAVVRVGWRENFLLAFAELTDADIFNSATRLNQRVWELRCF
ncbi:MAG: hypothetical protein ACREFE_13780 [Limisphaerales bacterium]